ncbi:hypothetical protein [Flavimaricola marinus]|uniref:Uncharacterized protein n=1 Tax=Flavimaricola marinus TaxID=1819565 RepID=A0A238L9A6_9RHOB|nr:hypothetical protein [Flavimaricola marinus]SMY06248.1 hypothetical protein LOM8899_00371 [Flavimaricola marinus]
MKPLVALVQKALGVGPLPYLALALAIIVAGVILQMRFPTAENLAGGRSIFGLMAQIGGGVGLFGLLTLSFNGNGNGGEAIPHDVPTSAVEARMDVVPGRIKPARPGASGPQSAAAGRLPALKSSPAAKMGLRMARQFGTRMLTQALRRKA